jgi:hypothetical protein
MKGCYLSKYVPRRCIRAAGLAVSQLTSRVLQVLAYISEVFSKACALVAAAAGAGLWCAVGSAPPDEMAMHHKEC